MMLRWVLGTGGGHLRAGCGVAVAVRPKWHPGQLSTHLQQPQARTASDAAQCTALHYSDAVSHAEFGLRVLAGLRGRERSRHSMCLSSGASTVLSSQAAQPACHAVPVPQGHANLLKQT